MFLIKAAGVPKKLRIAGSIAASYLFAWIYARNQQ
jgi:hypothetical protein